MKKIFKQKLNLFHFFIYFILQIEKIVKKYSLEFKKLTFYDFSLFITSSNILFYNLLYGGFIGFFECITVWINTKYQNK